MRRVMYVLLAVAVVSALSAAPDARARQGSVGQKATMTGTALANPGTQVYFWSSGAFVGFGTMGPDRELIYTPGSVPTPPGFKNCGATYASLQKWCDQPIAAHMVKCSSVDSAGQGDPSDPPLAEGDGMPPAMRAPGISGQFLVLMRPADEKPFATWLKGGQAPTSSGGTCRGPLTDERATTTFPDGAGVKIDESNGALTVTIVTPATSTSSDNGSSHTKAIVIGSTVAAAGAIGAIEFAGGSSNSTNGGTGGTGGTPDEQSIVNVVRTLSVSVTPTSQSCLGPGTGTITPTGPASATVITFGGQLASLPPLHGQVTTGTSAFVFSGSGTSTSPTGGTFGLTVTMNFPFAGGFNGTGTASNSCGTQAVTFGG